MKPAVLPPLSYRHSPNQSTRRAAVNLVVAHRWGLPPDPNEESEYIGTVNYLCNPVSDASAHIVYAGGEENKATQLVGWGRKAWACAAYNSRSDNIEFPDDIWFGKDDYGFRVAARIVAFRLYKRKLPATWVHGSALLAGKPGFTRHYDLGSLGGGHSDPTTDLTVWRDFVQLVQHERKRGGFRETWGHQ